MGTVPSATARNACSREAVRACRPVSSRPCSAGPGQQLGQGGLQRVGAAAGRAAQGARPRTPGSRGSGGAPFGTVNRMVAGCEAEISSGVPARATNAGLQDRDPVGEFLGLLEVMGGEDDGSATVDQSADDRPDGTSALRIQARGRLVEHHHARTAEQCQRQVQPSSLPSGQGAHPDVGATGEVHLLQGLRDRSRFGQRAGPGLHGLARRSGLQAARSAAAARPGAGERLPRSRRGSCPRTRTLPPEGAASPSTTSSAEVLPAPLTPSSANTCPGVNLEGDAADSMEVAVPALQTDHLDGGNCSRWGLPGPGVDVAFLHDASSERAPRPAAVRPVLCDAPPTLPPPAPRHMCQPS